MLGKAIKSQIEQQGLKISAVAAKANIPCNTFSAIVNGKRKVTAEEYFAICAALGVALDYFRSALQRKGA